MDRHMAQSLDRHITGNYGEDQFKEDPYPKYNNHDLNWRIGDKWNEPGGDIYILARMNDPINKDRFYMQFINIQNGNRFSEEVVVRQNHGEKDCCILTIDEITLLIYGRMGLGKSTSDQDNVIIDRLEDCHEYGPEWGW